MTGPVLVPREASRWCTEGGVKLERPIAARSAFRFDIAPLRVTALLVVLEVGRKDSCPAAPAGLPTWRAPACSALWPLRLPRLKSCAMIGAAFGRPRPCGSDTAPAITQCAYGGTRQT
jgi:hypothetical protein